MKYLSIEEVGSHFKINGDELEWCPMHQTEEPHEEEFWPVEYQMMKNEPTGMPMHPTYDKLYTFIGDAFGYGGEFFDYVKDGGRMSYENWCETKREHEQEPTTVQ